MSFSNPINTIVNPIIASVLAKYISRKSVYTFDYYVETVKKVWSQEILLRLFIDVNAFDYCNLEQEVMVAKSSHNHGDEIS